MVSIERASRCLSSLADQRESRPMYLTATQQCTSQPTPATSTLPHSMFNINTASCPQESASSSGVVHWHPPCNAAPSGGFFIANEDLFIKEVCFFELTSLQKCPQLSLSGLVKHMCARPLASSVSRSLPAHPVPAGASQVRIQGEQDPVVPAKPELIRVHTDQ